MHDTNGNSAANSRAALVVAHPGHELLVHGWLEITRPLVFVFTDGSGRTKHSRLGSTTGVLNETGARAGSIYGRFTDAEAYAAILNHNFEFFVGVASELCAAFVAEEIDFVAGDALEGYNPLHDVCRLVINAAVAAAARLRGKALTNYEFSLVNRPDACCGATQTEGVWQFLDHGAFARKITAAKGYAELSGEVQTALERTSIEAFRIEHLHPVDATSASRNGDHVPFYETYGEKQVEAGYYQSVLRYNEHLAPLADALKGFVETPIS